MINSNQKYYNWFNRLLDLAILQLSFICSAWIWLVVAHHDEGNIAYYFAFVNVIPPLIIFSLFVCVFQYIGVYDPYRFDSTVKELARLFPAFLFCCACAVGVLFLFKITFFSRGVVILFVLIGFVLLTLKRMLLRAILRRNRAKGFNLKHTVLVGCGYLAEKYVKAIAANPQLGFVCEGYVGDVDNSILGKRLGNYCELREMLKELNPDEIIVALEQKESSEIGKIIRICEQQGVRTSIIPAYNDFLPARANIDSFDDIRLINTRAIPLDITIKSAIKRMFDIVFSLLVLTLFSPVFLFLILGVKFSSPGPVFFKQKRVGKNNKEFYMYKFRSMRVNDTSDTAWSTNRDSRITPFGAFIRKFSLDELPQFVNVLLGDMSVIGPRPELPHFVEIYSETIPRYMVKHQVKPGITGWAQVNGYRGDTSIEKRIEYDIRYIEYWSVFLDIKIIFMTIFGGMMNAEKNIDFMSKKGKRNMP